MTTITKEIIQELIRTKEISLLSTHSRLCLPIINRIYKKMSAGIKFAGINVDSNMICDGHHRYVASVLADFPLEQYSGKRTAATSVIDWNFVVFEEEDWDTNAKIQMLNEEDAKYNSMSVEEIRQLLK